MTKDLEPNSTNGTFELDLAAVVRESVDEIYMIDALSGRFVYANQRALEDTGYTIEELRAMSPLDLQAGVDFETLVARVAPLQSGEREAVTFAVDYRRKDGGTIAVEHHVQYFRAHDPPVYLVHARPFGETGPARAPELDQSSPGIDLADVVRESVDQIYVINAITARYIYANDRALEGIGYSLEELRTMTLPEIESGVDLGTMLDGIAPLHEGEEQAVTFDTQYRRKDGSLLAVQHRVQYLAAHDPPVYLLNARLRDTDVSNREAARESQLYRRMVEDAAEGIWLIDAEHKTTYANETMANMLGYGREEMIGMSLFDFMDDEGRAIAEINLQRRQAGHSEAHDFKFTRKDGDEVWTIIGATPMFDRDGQYAGAFGIITDITQRKVQERALLQSLEVEIGDDVYGSAAPRGGPLAVRMPNVSGFRAERVARRFSVLSDPRRLELIELLGSGQEQPVTELAEKLHMNQSNASKHLKVLYDAGFVSRRTEGTRTFYALSDPTAAILCRVVAQWLGNQAQAEYQALAG